MYSTHGVFPVPPTVRLPTLMTGTGTRCTSRPRSKRWFRHQTPTAYGKRPAQSSRRQTNAAGSRAVPWTIARQRSGDRLTWPRRAATGSAGECSPDAGMGSTAIPGDHRAMYQSPRRLVITMLRRPGDPPLSLGLVPGRSALEWADIGLLAGALVVYLLLGIALPGLVLRPLFWVATRTIYRIRTYGAENVPATGPVLLLSNHVTYIDWLLMWA